MVVDCVISFDNNPQCVFFSGQTLNGTIQLVCGKPKKVKEILLKIKGFAHVHWSRRTRDAKGNFVEVHRRSFEGHVDYIDVKKDVFHSNGDRSHAESFLSESSSTITPGTHIFNFNHVIPPYCPTSFEGQHGHIRYYVKVILVRPWKFNQSFTKSFNVLKLVDLNYLGSPIRCPVLQNLERNFGIWPFNSGTFHLQISLPQIGYVAGQCIPITLVANNRSNVALNEVKIRLVMNVTFISTNPVSKLQSRLIIQRLRGRSIPKKSNQTLHFNLFVPPTPPSCIDLNSIIHITYDVELQLKPSGLHKKQFSKIEVVIGTIPLIYYRGSRSQSGLPFDFGRPSQTSIGINFEPSPASPGLVGANLNIVHQRSVPEIPALLRQPPFVSRSRLAAQRSLDQPSGRLLRYTASVATWPTPQPQTATVHGFTMARGNNHAPSSPWLTPRPQSAMANTQYFPPGQTYSSFTSTMERRLVPVNNRFPGNFNPLQNIPNCPPPLYEEAVHLPQRNQTFNEDGGQDYGEKFFKPFYPKFSFPKPTAPPSENAELISSTSSEEDDD